MKNNKKKNFEKLVSEVYSSRRISATDIVQEYCLGKILQLENGNFTGPLTKKDANNVRISAHNTTLIYDDGMSTPIFILDVISPKVYCEPEIFPPIVTEKHIGNFTIAVSYCPICLNEVNNMVFECPKCKTILKWF